MNQKKIDIFCLQFLERFEERRSNFLLVVLSSQFCDEEDFFSFYSAVFDCFADFFFVVVHLLFWREGGRGRGGKKMRNIFREMNDKFFFFF